MVFLPFSIVVILPNNNSQINLFLSFCFFTFSICFLFSILFYSVFKVHLVGSSGLEPPTSRLSGECSSLLSYEPVQCSSQLVFTHPWWRWRDSNSWPPACRAGALPTELHPRSFFQLFRVPSDPENRTTIDLQSSLFPRTRISSFVFFVR